MTAQERDTLNDTLAHIRQVQTYLFEVCGRLMKRARDHDDTKLGAAEFPHFVHVQGQLEEIEYGSERYDELIGELRETALAHHYATQDHHPEFEENGIEDMDLLQITELLVDWKAASERHEDGNIHESIEHNAGRFGYGTEMQRLLHNTAETLFDDPVPDSYERV